MNALERTLMYALLMVLILTGLGCDEFQSADHLRNVSHPDPGAYFQSDRLRTNTLNACHGGTDAQQAAWANLDACRVAASAEMAKRKGWKP
jgi:hypothetical protein